MSKPTTPQEAWGCPYCFVISSVVGEPPHGWDNPCPLKVRVDEAYIEKMDAERMYYIRGGSSMGDVAQSFRKMTGTDDE